MPTAPALSTRLLAACVLALSLAGCFPWGSRAVRYVPEETALQRSYDYGGEVVVVGAGAAGLAAARVLEDNGISYTLLEATERYGGRLKATHDFADVPLDLGAEWIHNQPSILDTLSGTPGTAEGLALTRQNLGEAYRWTGQRYKRMRPALVRALHRFFPEYKFADSTWYDFVREHFAERVDHHIRYGVTVAAIDHTGDRVAVTTADGEVVWADKVLVTVSVGVLRSGDLRFEPPLAPDKVAALDAVFFPPGFKAFLKFSDRFYPDTLIQRSRGGEKGFYDATLGKDTKENILGVLVTGDLAAPYAGLESDAEVQAALLAELDEAFDGKATETHTGAFLLERWGQAPHTRGTWVEGFRIPPADLVALTRPLDRQVYFAGEAYDVDQQLGVPGAILSGLHAVDRLLTGAD